MKLLSLICLFVLTSSPFASAQIPATRGLENSRLDQYVAALHSQDLKGVADWLDNSGFQQLSAFVRQSGEKSVTALVPQLANRIFKEQQKVRANRQKFVLLQIALEETVMLAGIQTAIFTGDIQLTSEERAIAGKIRGVSVRSGDTIVQIGGGALSSHFIAHSQSLPGLASHSLLVSWGGETPEILESLIEDGANRRAPYSGALARFYVLSAKTADERARIGGSTQKFIDDFEIPFVAEGEISHSSPLFYDSTMNPERKKDGYYFCSVTVQEVHIRAGVSVNPFPEDKSNWNILEEGSIERSLYRELNITQSKVPAPGDALLNPEMAIRALVLDGSALKTSRRLRAVIDGFFDILYGNEQVRKELLAAFRLIPAVDVHKKQILAAFDKLAADPQMVGLIGNKGISSVRDARKALEETLPQAANMRQIAFFVLMNSVVQDKALAGLKDYEEKVLKRHALPGELRAAATQMLAGEIAKLRLALNRMGSAL